MNDTLSDPVTLSEARLAIQDGDNERVAALYIALVDQNPADKQIIDEATSVLAAMGRRDDAVAILESTMSRLSDSPFLLKRMAEIFDAAGQKAEKAKAWRRIAAVSPPSTKIALYWGDAAADVELYDEAAEAYRQGLAIFPDEPTLLYRLGQVLVLSGARDEALATLAGAMKPEAGYIPCYVLLAEILLERQQFMEALTAITGALALDANHVRANGLRGDILQFMGQPVLAADAFRLALSHSPDDIQSLLGLGLVESRVGNLSEGIALMHRVLALDPNNDLARQRRKKWERLLPPAAASA